MNKFVVLCMVSVSLTIHAGKEAQLSNNYNSNVFKENLSENSNELNKYTEYNPEIKTLEHIVWKRKKHWIFRLLCCCK